MSAYRLVMIWILGFASGLPLALTGTAMQAWLAVENVDIATIGFFSLVGLPYTFKFLWAPLMDRFEIPFFGRRKGWLFLSQAAICLALLLMSSINPTQNTQGFALAALLIAFLSASQDVVIDAYRTDVLTPSERGLGSSLSVFGYRLAMILSSGITLLWADPVNGKGWSWSYIYIIMAVIMAVASVVSLVFLPKVSLKNHVPQSLAKNDVFGFLSVLLAVALGYLFTTKLVDPILAEVFSLNLPDTSTQLKKWVDLLSLFIGLGVTLPFTYFVSQKSKFETFNNSLKSFFTLKNAGGILIFIILYKLGDAFAGALTTAFLIKGIGFAQAEIGVVNKVIGMWLTILGAILGGTLMARLGLYRSLMLFGVLQLLSNLGFWLVAVSGKGAWGAFDLPAFDFIIVSLKDATSVDYLLMFAVSIENLSGGMGTAAFVAFLMALCNQKFTATQYALLSAFASIGRVWVGPLSGVLSESIGWPAFFLFSTVMAVPGLILLKKLKNSIVLLETPEISGVLDD